MSPKPCFKCLWLQVFNDPWPATSFLERLHIAWPIPDGQSELYLLQTVLPVMGQEEPEDLQSAHSQGMATPFRFDHSAPPPTVHPTCALHALFSMREQAGGGRAEDHKPTGSHAESDCGVPGDLFFEKLPR